MRDPVVERSLLIKDPKDLGILESKKAGMTVAQAQIRPTFTSRILEKVSVWWVKKFKWAKDLRPVCYDDSLVSLIDHIDELLRLNHAHDAAYTGAVTIIS